jgi:hypothetical protein
LRDHSVKELQVERMRGALHGLRESLSLDVGERRIMRVHALHSNVARDGVDRFRKRLPPGFVGVVAQTAPIDCAEDNGATHAEQDDTQCQERIVHPAHRLNPASAKRMTDGRSDVGAKSGEVQCGGHGSTRNRIEE